MNKYVTLLALLIIATQTNGQPADSTILKQQELITAQIEKTKAQTAYYKNSKSEKPGGGLLKEMLPGILGALVGGGMAFLGILWSANRQEKTEKKKRIEAKKDETSNDIKSATANLIKKLAAEVQAIMWLTYIGKYDAEAMKNEDIDEYNKEMKVLFKEDMEAQAYLATVEPKLYEKIKPLIKIVSGIDHDMAAALRQFLNIPSQNDRSKEAQAIGAFYDKIAAFYHKMPAMFGDILPGPRRIFDKAKV
jgi:hypothetical protein